RREPEPLGLQVILRVALVGGRGLDLLLTLESVEQRQVEPQRERVRVRREPERKRLVLRPELRRLGGRQHERAARRDAREARAAPQGVLLVALGLRRCERLLRLVDEVIPVRVLLRRAADRRAQAERRRVQAALAEIALVGGLAPRDEPGERRIRL